MRKRPIRLALAALFLLYGCSGENEIPGERRFEMTGLVLESSGSGTVSIAHEAVPDFMPAMVMPFTLEDPSEGDELSPGDRVSFTLRVTPSASRATNFVVTGRDMRTLGAYAAARATETRRVRPGDPVPAFELVDQEGRTFTDADLAGEPTVLTFIFTRCPLPEFCPLVMTRLAQVERETAADPALAGTRLLSITLDPGFDTPEILKEYGRARQVDFARWRLATGTPQQVTALTGAFSVHVEPAAGTIDHTLATALIDANGRIVEIWRGTFWETSEILEALRQVP